MVVSGYFINAADDLPFVKVPRAESSGVGGKLPAELGKYPSDPTIIFFASKNESFRAGDNYKTFQKKLKTRVHKVIQ